MFLSQFTDSPGKFRRVGHGDPGGEVFAEIFVVIFQGVATEQVIVELFEDSFRDKQFVLLHAVIHVTDADAAGILMVQEKIIMSKKRRLASRHSGLLQYACFLVLR